MNPNDYIYFFTATILNWEKLLDDEECKHLITNSLSHLVEKKKISVYAFVVMPNHIHLVWSALPPYDYDKIQGDLLRFTAHQFKKHLSDNQPKKLESFHVGRIDRAYQFWQRYPLSVELYTRDVISQKIEYVHNNPVQERWGLAETPEQYRFSSANFYMNGSQTWPFLTHIMEDW